jgi:hypothetical protein
VTSPGLVPADGSSGESEVGTASAASWPTGNEVRLACGVAGIEFTGTKGGADLSDPEVHCAEGMAPTYSGPQQGQFRQHVLAAFFLKGQCSWMNCVKHLNLRTSKHVRLTGFRSHFLVVAQAAQPVCGEASTWDAVGVDHP